MNMKKVENLETQLRNIDEKIRKLEFRKLQIQRQIADLSSTPVINASSATAKNLVSGASQANQILQNEVESVASVESTREASTSSLHVVKGAVL